MVGCSIVNMGSKRMRGKSAVAELLESCARAEPTHRVQRAVHAANNFQGVFIIDVSTSLPDTRCREHPNRIAVERAAQMLKLARPCRFLIGRLRWGRHSWLPSNP